MFRYQFLLFFFVCLHFSLLGQSQNYGEIFGEKYEQAEEFINQNQNTFRKYFPDSSEFQLATSIVFPEIIRYNELSDKIEVEVLKTLYVQYGDQYANFSIGPFQMKPTFAEQLEKDFHQFKIELCRNKFGGFDTTSAKEARIKRVERLSTFDGQLMYLSLFHEISGIIFRELLFDTSDYRVRFLSAAYNSGFHNSIENIARRAKDKQFHTDIISGLKSRKYCYSDISAYYFCHSKIR